MRRILSLCLAALLPAGAALSQTRLTGLAEVPCPTAALGLGDQVVCRKPTWCMTPLRPHYAQWAGATAWDETLEAAWVSDGSTYAVAVPSVCKDPCKCACKILCKAMWPIKNYITGMAMNSARRLLYISDSNHAIRTFRVYGPCKIKQIRSCSIRLPSRWFITGLAYDKVHDYLFYVTSRFHNLLPGASVIYVAKASSPCNPFCKWELPKCPTGPFGSATGLAFDPCKYTLFVSGTLGKTAVVQWDGKCGFKLRSCCPSNPIKRYYGLGLRTSACAPFFGSLYKTSWASSPCPNLECQKCEPLPGYAGGLPRVGNLNFRLTMTKGPNPRKYRSFVFLLINFAGHCKPQKLPYPCGPLYLYPVPDAWLYATAVPSMGGAMKCSLSAAYRLPIPADPALCCFKLCGQWAVLNLRVGMPPLPWCLTASKEFTLRIGG